MNNPDDRRRAHAWQAKGDRSKEESDWAGAERSLRAAMSAFTLLEDSSAIGRVLASLAELSLLKGDFLTAADLGRQAVERVPGDVRALTGLGYAQWLNGSLADGEVTFGQALRADRSAVRALAGRGQVRVELGKYRDALSDLDRAIELGIPVEHETDVHSAHALALAGLGGFEDADAEIARALENEPDRLRTRLRAGWIAALAGRADEARDELERMASLGGVYTPSRARAARLLLARLGGALA